VINRVRRLSDDSGFTLVELIAAIVIMGVITIPLGNFMLEYLQNTTDSQARISDSHDMQIAAAYFSQDVSNMGLRDASYNFQASAWRPDAATLPAQYCGQSSGNLVLLLKWNAVNTTTAAGGVTTEAAPKVSSAAYVNESGSLHRLYCDSSNSTTSDTPLVDSLSSAAATCDNTTTCDTVTPPSTITLNLVIASAGDRASPGSVPLIEHRRQ